MLYLKYVVAILLLLAIFFAPAYLAGLTGKSKYDALRTRCGSWLFGWTIIGWIYALFVSSSKKK
ncbi:MAG: ribosome modulation factor [Alphaproteobacteria bacterium]|nr:ribosome modulation factor [Alphaproteobacteria bacterium]